MQDPTEEQNFPGQTTGHSNFWGQQYLTFRVNLWAFHFGCGHWMQTYSVSNV
jgi:hypothetical protein